MISPERLDQLQVAWVRLLAHYSIEPVAAYPVFDRLVAAHSEPHRFYHTLEHLNEMFKVAGKLADSTNDPMGIQLAIWFHDFVYDSRLSDNEDRSAALAAEMLHPLGIPDEILARVAVMIRATAHTAVDSLDVDTAVLLDADLAILSAEERRYARYAADIRREYAWVEEEAYRAGRTKVLEAFLARPRIYRTERMHTAADAAARTNLRGEIAGLRAGT